MGKIPGKVFIMKKFLITSLVFAGLSVFTGCGDDASKAVSKVSAEAKNVKTTLNKIAQDANDKIYAEIDGYEKKTVEDSPKAAAGKYLQAVLAGDLAAANQYSIDKFAKDNDLLIKTLQTDSKALETLKGIFAELERYEEQVDGDSVKLLKNGEKTVMTLIKTDGQWKVCKL